MCQYLFLSKVEFQLKVFLHSFDDTNTEQTWHLTRDLCPKVKFHHNTTPTNHSRPKCHGSKDCFCVPPHVGAKTNQSQYFEFVYGRNNNNIAVTGRPDISIIGTKIDFAYSLRECRLILAINMRFKQYYSLIHHNTCNVPNALSS